MSTQPAPLPTRSGPAATAASWLTATTAALVAGVSAVGLFTAGLYTDSEAVEAMFRGFDLITLVVVAPLLAASLLPGWRKRPAVQLVPAYLLAAVWLWRRRPWGLLLATIVLLAGALHQLSYVSAMLFQLDADVPGAAFDLYEPAIIALYLAGSVLLLINLRTLEPTVTAPTQERAPVQAGR